MSKKKNSSENSPGPSGWGAVWKVNFDFLRATFGFGGTWLFWQMAVPGFEMFRLFAAMFAAGGAVAAGQGLIGTVRLILSLRKWVRYRAKGAKPKADKLADADALRKAGLIK